MLKPHNHPVESHGRTALRNYIIQASTLLEITLSGLVFIGLLFSIVPLLKWMPGLLFDGNDAEIRTFLERALDIVIGIEFIKMLAKHSPGSSLEVLPENCEVLQIKNPILTSVELLKIKYMDNPGFRVEIISLLYYKSTPLENAVERLFVACDRAYSRGGEYPDSL